MEILATANASEDKGRENLRKVNDEALLSAINYYFCSFK